MRRGLGTAVFFGMLGVTAFGLLLTPACCTFIRRLGTRRAERSEISLEISGMVLHHKQLGTICGTAWRQCPRRGVMP